MSDDDFKTESPPPNPNKPVHLSVRASTRDAIDELRKELRRRDLSTLPPEVGETLIEREWTADTIVLAGLAAIRWGLGERER